MRRMPIRGSYLSFYRTFPKQQQVANMADKTCDTSSLLSHESTDSAISDIFGFFCDEAAAQSVLNRAQHTVSWINSGVKV